MINKNYQIDMSMKFIALVYRKEIGLDFNPLYEAHILTLNEQISTEIFTNILKYTLMLLANR